MKEFKALFTGKGGLIGLGFLVGWIAGRVTAVGLEGGGTLIGGVIVSLIVTIAANKLLKS